MTRQQKRRLERESLKNQKNSYQKRSNPKLFGYSLHYRGDKDNGINLAFNKLNPLWNMMEDTLNIVMDSHDDPLSSFMVEYNISNNKPLFIAETFMQLDQAIQAWWLYQAPLYNGKQPPMLDSNGKLITIKHEISEKTLDMLIVIMTDIYSLEKLGYINADEYNGYNYMYSN